MRRVQLEGLEMTNCEKAMEILHRTMMEMTLRQNI